MSSPGSRRNSCRGVAAGSRSSSECPPGRRRTSSCPYFSPGAQAEDFSVSSNQPMFAITSRFSSAVDSWSSKRLGVCACEESPWGSIRPSVRSSELSGHVIPWLTGTVYSSLRGESVAEQELMSNLTLALISDSSSVRAVKTSVRRRTPVQSRSDILSAFFVERYSFPSGHASRATMCARFFLAQGADTASMRVSVVAWAVSVSLSRLSLARHYVTDVGFGSAMGYCQYSVVERLWVTMDSSQDSLFIRSRESSESAYDRSWMADWKQ